MTRLMKKRYKRLVKIASVNMNKKKSIQVTFIDFAVLNFKENGYFPMIDQEQFNILICFSTLFLTFMLGIFDGIFCGRFLRVLFLL